MKRHDPQTVRFHAIVDEHAVQVVWGLHVKTQFPRHTHRGFCIGIVDQGGRVISHSGATTVVPEGHVFVLNPGDSHACGPLEKQGHSYRIVCAETDFLQSVASQISEKTERVPYFRSVLLADTKLARLTNLLFAVLDRGASLLEQQSALMSLFARLILFHAVEEPALYRADAQRGPIGRAREYIDAHFAANLSLKQLAQIACLSPFHFQRVFVSVVGVSPHEYLTQSRLRKAREFLRDGFSILDAALETGFADQSHFTRLFKRSVGMTPGQYVHLARGQHFSGVVSPYEVYNPALRRGVFRPMAPEKESETDCNTYADGQKSCPIDSS